MADGQPGLRDMAAELDEIQESLRAALAALVRLEAHAELLTAAQGPVQILHGAVRDMHGQLKDAVLAAVGKFENDMAFSAPEMTQVRISELRERIAAVFEEAS